MLTVTPLEKGKITFWAGVVVAQIYWRAYVPFLPPHTLSANQLTAHIIALTFQPITSLLTPSWMLSFKPRFSDVSARRLEPMDTSQAFLPITSLYVVRQSLATPTQAIKSDYLGTMLVNA